MLRLASAALIIAAMALGGTSVALAETQATPVAQTSSPPAADFGAPPSGQIPILYNDRHVYANPDVLKQGRVLAALARGGTIYVPLRSMFEQMGATVSYDPGSKTATVSKAGAEVVVTVGKPEVVINGESRPLDVPPIIYHGDVLVPIRVISEGMGGYVQWVPDRHIVVVRYLAATPPPTEAPPPPPPPVPEATVAPPPPPTPNPLTLGGYFRSYYFTRQNATNNPGTQFDFAPGAKYNSNGVNQATWANAIALHGDYAWPDTGWHVGGTYLYSTSFGSCAVPANNAKGAECVSQVPPNTNQDETLPPFALSTFYEGYFGYNAHGFNGEAGNVLFVSPWANPADSRLKPAAFQGAYLSYTTPSNWTIEGADMFTFENRTSSSFTQQTLLTSFPAGNNGMAPNIYNPGGVGINTNGFAMGKLGYGKPTGPGFSADGYFYGVSDLVNMWWGDGKYTFNGPAAPYIALQGGTESNAGVSYIGKVDSQVFGAQIGANVTKNILLTVGYDQIPWKTDSIFLPKDVTCSNSNYQVTAKGATLAYFLPLNTAQCFTNPNGTTNIYYGGWASPYTDNYDSDPLFTTSVTQGQVDRRAPGSSYKVGLQYTSTNQKFIFIAADAWYNYGNALAPEMTNIWSLDGRYRFGHVGKGPYHGLVLRDRYIQRSLTNTFCGAAGTTSCPAGSTLGASEFGGLPLFKYNRAQLEYDF
ncbi:MAG: copper amine oxidase N-terminal domain-containing protein [Candidatus Eremiobacteraeota bacterium]|nr:copper amine oxidase N-terminal domain-containing protein [Candidatus Eremiobacteraeota bacterium]